MDPSLTAEQSGMVFEKIIVRRKAISFVVCGCPSLPAVVIAITGSVPLSGGCRDRSPKAASVDRITGGQERRGEVPPTAGPNSTTCRGGSSKRPGAPQVRTGSALYANSTSFSLFLLSPSLLVPLTSSPSLIHLLFLDISYIMEPQKHLLLKHLTYKFSSLLLQHMSCNACHNYPPDSQLVSSVSYLVTSFQVEKILLLNFSEYENVVCFNAFGLYL